LLVVATGLFLRVRGYLFAASAFWLDECSWAMMLVEEPIRELAIRPIAFLAISKGLGQLFGLTELSLRALPWLAGMATTLLAVPLSQRLFRSPAARLLFVFIIALHPCAIDFSKEFKPYSVSLYLHLSLALLALQYFQTRSRAALTALLLIAASGTLFAQDILFAYPSAFLLVGFTAWRTNRKHFVAVAATAGFIVLLLVAQDLMFWRHAVTRDDVSTWTEKYSVFYARDTGETPFRWALDRYLGMSAFPGFRRTLWRPWFFEHDLLDTFASVDEVIWCCLHFVGLFVLLRRRHVEAVVLLVPLVTLWFFNLIRLWPIGVFRTNLFILVYVAGIACMALDALPAKLPRFVQALPALVLVLLPLALFDRAWSAQKQALTFSSAFPDTLKELLRLKRENAGRRETLLLDRRSCAPFRYYTEFQPRVSRRLRPALDAEFDTHCILSDLPSREINDATPEKPSEVWAVLHADRAVTAAIRGHTLGRAPIRHEKRVGQHIIVAFSRKAN
jgi:hypothetical protein